MIRLYPTDFPNTSIQGALDALQPGDTLEFEPGVYQHDSALWLMGDNKGIYSRKAVIESTTPRAASFILKGNNLSVTGLTFKGNGLSRSQSDQSCGLLVVDSQNVKIIRNSVHGFAGAGMMFQRTKDFVVDANLVYDTFADGIHITNRCENGEIKNNTTRNTGDDGIACVGYLKNRGILRNMSIYDNQVLGNLWGRGITIEGTHDAYVYDNLIRDTAQAGIIAASGSSYGHYGVKNLRIRNNHIIGANYDRETVHGAIMLSARDGFELDADGNEVSFNIEDVYVGDNTIENTVGASSDVRISNFCKRVTLLVGTHNDEDGSHKSYLVYRGADVTVL